ncbi:MAG TPA: molybdopterin molybdotransferase MoeA [Anaerolineaceae bacterium]|jgi:molybdopterin molybdotransferase|nr:molybdopterin molybdotransferase MoeA [Anaerolineaceae bacterium]
MLAVKALADVQMLVKDYFGEIRTAPEMISFENAADRILAEDIIARECVPAFPRATVDGYAVKCSDIFGCSDAIPAMLKLVGEAIMGKHTDRNLDSGQCVSVPTGGEVPEGADAVVMLEDVEDFGDGTIGIRKPVAPGSNLIFPGDDGKAGELVYRKGKKLSAKDIGTLAAMGIIAVPVMKLPRIVIISSGDELVDARAVLPLGKIRDVNGPMLKMAVGECGGEAAFSGIVIDDQHALRDAVLQTINECEILVLTGGTSAGTKDAIPEVISALGELLVHGVAIKPGKPTIVGKIDHVPVFGLPGNPVAAYLMFLLLVKPLVLSMLGAVGIETARTMPLARTVSSNQGREDLIPVSIKNGLADPIIGKSGLITTLANADGYFRIARDQEGLKAGEPVKVFLFEE